MNVLNKYIEDNVVHVVLDNVADWCNYIKVGVDFAVNYESNRNKDSHDLVFEFSDDTLSNDLALDIPSYAPALLIITIYAKGQYQTDILQVMFLNQYSLYKMQNLVIDECNNCHCENNVNKLIAFLLRIQLLEYAYDNELFGDAIKFFKDLYRLTAREVSFESIPEKYNDIVK